jgi:hypothetical protein
MGKESLARTKEIFLFNQKEVQSGFGVAVDLDGVIVNSTRIFELRVLQETGVDINALRVSGRSIPYDYTDIPEIAGDPEKVAAVLNIWRDPKSYQDVEPFPEVVKILTYWRQLGYQLVFPSGRAKTLRGVTEKCLKKVRLGWVINRVVYATSFGIDRAEFKNWVANTLQLKVFIEDCAEYLVGMNSQSLLIKILLDHYYNQNQASENLICRAKNWGEINLLTHEAAAVWQKLMYQ